MKEIIRHQNYWNNSASIYNGIIEGELSGLKKGSWEKILHDHIKNDTQLNILEIGTGPGFFAILLAQMGHMVTAVDFSKEMLKKAHKNATALEVSIEFVHTSDASIYEIPETYDLIISRNVTWTLRHPESTYSNWYILLKKGGSVLIFDANWNIGIANKLHAEIYEKDIENAVQLGFPIYDEEQLFNEGDQISNNLPLTFAMRPEWDKAMLFQLGFRAINVRHDFDHLIYTEAEQVAYSSIPYFSITAVK